MRNQIAHVKAERDILAEADTEWVVKLYYSFQVIMLLYESFRSSLQSMKFHYILYPIPSTRQDEKSLYFVMDYVPGGDMMALLIKKGIFEERLAQFYIAELTLALQVMDAEGKYTKAFEQLETLETFIRIQPI